MTNLNRLTDSMTTLARHTVGASGGEEERGHPPTRGDPGGKGKGPARVPTNNGDPGNQAGPSQPRIHGGILQPPVLPPPGPDPDPGNTVNDGDDEEDDDSEDEDRFTRRVGFAIAKSGKKPADPPFKFKRRKGQKVKYWL